MSNSFELQAEFREDLGKGASRRLRHAGNVPAVVYGGNAEPRSITLNHQALLRHVENEAFFSNVITLKVGDVEQDAIVKDMQRHPAKKVIMHIDFQRIVAGEQIRMSVPLHFTGEDIAPGFKTGGGKFSHLINEVEIACLPKNLPEFIEVDVSELELDALLHMSDIQLPEGVEIPELAQGDGHDQAIITLQRPAVIVEEEDEVDAGDVPTEGDEEAPEDGAE